MRCAWARHGARSCVRVPTITVCLVTHNRPHYVRTCLESLRVQTVGLDGFDVIVVDSCGRPETAPSCPVGGETCPMRDCCGSTGPARARPAICGAEIQPAISSLISMTTAGDARLGRADPGGHRRNASPGPASSAARSCRSGKQPLPDWWPESLRGVLSIIEWEGRGEFRTKAVPAGLEPYGVNMVVQRAAAAGHGRLCRPARPLRRAAAVRRGCAGRLEVAGSRAIPHGTTAESSCITRSRPPGCARNG